jgi:hypothetical protein
MKKRHPQSGPSWRVPVGSLLLASALIGSAAAAPSPRCNLTPSSPSIDAGAALQWSATVTDIGKSRRSYDWAFGGGAPSSSSASKADVVYDQAGTWSTSLRVSDGRRTAECSASVTVLAADTGGGSGGGAAPEISINSTSQDSFGPVTEAVPEQPMVVNGGYSILAINDLGMHCGDLDTRVASILPPFQVLLAQVIRKGREPELNPVGVDLYYSAASNPADPILEQGQRDGLRSDGSSYKTNFWKTVGKGTYDPFYPAFNPFDPTFTLTPLAADPFNVGPDVGLPVPNVEELYIGHDGEVRSGDERLTAVLHAMRGISDPYVANTPQQVQEYYGDKPFFVNFPFGYVAEEVNWYEGAGVPYASFDDFGRENAYPVVRVQAKQGTSVLTTVDTVLPISGEASCTNCHADPADVQDSRTSAPTDVLKKAGLPVATSVDDPDDTMPSKVSVEYAGDINILRLHDLKHGANYVDTAHRPAPCDITVDAGNGDATCLTNIVLIQEKPVVCQVCHYTPALDLAQLGPLAGEPGTLANGRNQLAHKSNSNVMHSHHGTLKGANGDPLFPEIQAPVQLEDGSIGNQGDRLAALEESCYQCHPGKSTQCLRGAMFNGGMLCSDCHGNMEQVGNDFSRDVSPSNPGAFQLAKDFYTNPDTPRVPWANEPGCGSCHTGDALDNLARPATGDVIVNNKDTDGNPDGIRLRQAFRIDDPKATPIVPSNKRFAEPLIPESFNGFPNPGAGNPKLYRVSSGHEGVMCEGCHGATHAEWPNANPNANDNLTANQLQGHSGTIIACSTCHADGLGDYRGLGGPHGLHVVGATKFADGGHKELAEKTPDACRACHGENGEGTVLARIAADRVLECKENGLFCGSSKTKLFPKGKMVRCDDCHKNEL